MTAKRDTRWTPTRDRAAGLDPRRRHGHAPRPALSQAAHRARRAGRASWRSRSTTCAASSASDLRITVVVGFKHDLIMEQFPDVLFAYNENYDQTNTSKSLLRALGVSHEGGVLWLNGDVVFDARILDTLRPLIEAEQSFVCVNTDAVGEEEVKYTVDDGGFIRELSKTVESALGEAVGINFVASADKAVLMEHLDQCDDQDYFERGIETAIADGRAAGAPGRHLRVLRRRGRLRGRPGASEHGHLRWSSPPPPGRPVVIGHRGLGSGESSTAIARTPSARSWLPSRPASTGSRSTYAAPATTGSSSPTTRRTTTDCSSSTRTPPRHPRRGTLLLDDLLDALPARRRRRLRPQDVDGGRDRATPTRPRPPCSRRSPRARRTGARSP